MQGGDYDLFAGERSQRLRDVLGVLRREAGDGFVEKEDFGPATEIDSEIEPAAFTSGNGFFLPIKPKPIVAVSLFLLALAQKLNFSAPDIS